MRKILFVVLAAGLFSSAIFSQQRCASYENLQRQMAEDPGFARKVRETEKSFANYKRQTGKKDQRGRPSSITIPLVVHIVYNTADQNISDAQIQSQIDVLNEDFTATNKDYNSYDAGYGSVKGDAGIQFCLDQVVRKQTGKKSFGFTDQVKKDKHGGSNAIDPIHKLNIWVCNLGQSLLGYAQFPGGPAETFGVVCHYQAFGSGASYDLFTNYNLGRTATHEVGHCLGLRHIWGDSRCGNDLVEDTPEQDEANVGCPPEGLESECAGNPLEMWMNYMDYCYDRCVYFFSDGQVSRMDYFIDNDAQINSIVNSGCNDTRTNSSDITAATNRIITSGRAVDAELSLYPTITQGLLNLSTGKQVNGKAEITIYNQTGGLLMKQRIIFSGKTFDQLDVSRLANGMYFLQLNDGVNKRTRKFIVQH